MKAKLTSRKLWMALISIIVGILTIFGVDDSLVQLISGILLILVPAVVYIITEGKIDASAASKIDWDTLVDNLETYLAKCDSPIAKKIAALLALIPDTDTTTETASTTTETASSTTTLDTTTSGT